MYKIINIYNDIYLCILYNLKLKKIIYIIISRIYPLNPMSHLSGIVISSSPQPNPSINYIHFLLEIFPVCQCCPIRIRRNNSDPDPILSFLLPKVDKVLQNGAR